MTFWQDTSLITLLVVALLLGCSKILQQIPAIKMIPFSIIAGIIGFLLQNFGVIELDQGALERIVYHGLAITFIAIGLQKPPEEAKNEDAIAMGLGISIMAVLQGLIAILCIAVLSTFGKPLHPGLGLLLPLGLNQGPGQALSMGNAWEATGLENGGQIGLILAASGFLWAIFLGIPLAIYGTKKGWVKTNNPISPDKIIENNNPKESEGDINTHVIVISVIYLFTFGILYGLHTGPLANNTKLMSMLWGFHFLIALIVSLSTRSWWHKIHFTLSNTTLTHITNTTVDFVTCAALIAVQFSILKANLFTISLLSILGMVFTFFGVLYLSKRGFHRDRFEHALLWFGSSTGTLPMGLALLRIIDPDLQSAAPTSATKGAIFALIFSAPLLLFVMPYAISQWPDGYPTTNYILIGIFTIYALIILVFWKKLANLGAHSSFVDKKQEG
jgi:glutamate:Na+ symporter, ESS family